MSTLEPMQCESEPTEDSAIKTDLKVKKVSEETNKHRSPLLEGTRYMIEKEWLELTQPEWYNIYCSDDDNNNDDSKD